MKQYGLTILLALLLLSVPIAHGLAQEMKKKEAQTKETQTKETQTKEEYQVKVEAILQDLNQNIEALKQKAAQQSSKTKTEMYHFHVKLEPVLIPNL